ncbi:hypothetical protein [Marilutibacter alkalisoli]|uniref:Uncharacterized protein n=1 Tax=Marilutibacter alkalisoli TaxID=2591633 RepID=A0A514BRN6_9GAMM|nr:hypothetical protein [Lysobacter alkalisoli]QDH70053.1 hypothetical protein FKV23_08035 [Lysobacter alkalisoli]
MMRARVGIFEAPRPAGRSRGINLVRLLSCFVAIPIIVTACDDARELKKANKEMETCVMSLGLKNRIIEKGIHSKDEVEAVLSRYRYDADRACFAQRWSFPEGVYASVTTSNWMSGESLRVSFMRFDPALSMQTRDSVLIRPVGGHLEFSSIYELAFQERAGEKIAVIGDGVDVYQSKLSNASTWVHIAVERELYATAVFEKGEVLNFASAKGLAQVGADFKPGYEIRYKIPAKHAPFIREINSSIKESIESFMLPKE